MLKYALLGFLNYQSLTGYDLKRIMESSTSNFWHADLSQIYKTLKALEADSAITSVIEAQDERPDRRIYTITERGRSDLYGWLSTPLTEITPMKETLLLKLFFAGNGDRAQVLTLLRLQRELHNKKLNQYEHQTVTDIQQNAAFMDASENDKLFWDFTRRAGVLYEQMVIEWLDETIARLEAQ